MTEPKTTFAENAATTNKTDDTAQEDNVGNKQLGGRKRRRSRKKGRKSRKAKKSVKSRKSRKASKTRKKKRGLNPYFKLMLAAKRKGSASFKYKGKTYKGKKHKRLGMIYKKA